jgi:hypothetical protein
LDDPEILRFNVVDNVTCESPASIPETSISGRRVARELAALIERRENPDLEHRLDVYVLGTGIEGLEGVSLGHVPAQRGRPAPAEPGNLLETPT